MCINQVCRLEQHELLATYPIRTVVNTQRYRKFDFVPGFFKAIYLPFPSTWAPYLTTYDKRTHRLHTRVSCAHRVHTEQPCDLQQETHFSFSRLRTKIPFVSRAISVIFVGCLGFFPFEAGQTRLQTVPFHLQLSMQVTCSWRLRNRRYSGAKMRTVPHLPISSTHQPQVR